MPREEIRYIIKEANGKSTISIEPRDSNGIPVRVGDCFGQAQMGGYNRYEFEVAGFTNAKALFIHDNCPRFWQEMWELADDEQKLATGVVLKRKGMPELYEIRSLAEVAGILKDRRERGASKITPLG